MFNERVSLKLGLASFVFLATGGFPFSPALGTTPASTTQVELTHWWVSPGEKAALNEIRKAVEQRGAQFIDTPIPNYDKLRERVIDRLSNGYPPSMTQWLAGRDMLELAAIDAILPTPVEWRGQRLDKILYPEILAEVSKDGKVVSIPVGIHIQNTAFYNAGIYRELKLEPATSWEEFLKQAEKIKAAGYTAIALSDEPWQLRFIFNDILMGEIGVDGFLKFYDEQQPIENLRSAIVKSIGIFLRLQDFADPGHKDRLWNKATDEVMSGRAAMQVMGDFAKGEMSVAGLIPEKDFLCSLAPGAKGTMMFATDSFVMLESKNDSIQKGQELLFDVLLDPQLQAAFNSRKGGLPVRYGVDENSLDACSRKLYNIWLNPSANTSRLPDTTSRLRLTFVQQLLHTAWQEHWSAEKTADELIRLIDDAWKNMRRDGKSATEQ